MDRRSVDVVQSLGGQPAYQTNVMVATSPEASLSDTDQTELTEATYDTFDQRRGLSSVWKLVAVGAVAVLLLTGAIVAIVQRGNHAAQLKAGSFKTASIPLDGLSVSNSGSSVKSLKVNGSLQVANSVILTPSSQPSNPVAGQLYFDKTASQLSYYNGQGFVNVASGTSNNTNTTNITNVLSGSGNGVQLQNGSPGVQQAGNFNISGVGKVGSLSTTVINSDGGTLYINPVSATAQQQVAVGTPATVGLQNGASSAPGPGWANDLTATKVTLGGVGGIAKSITMQFTGGTGSGHVQVGLYDDDGNVPSKPGNLLASSVSTVAVVNGFTTVDIPNVNLAANGVYWLAVNTDDNTVGRTYNAGSKATCFKTSGFGFMPDPFGGCFPDNNVYTIYLNYTLGAGTSGALSQAHLVIGPTGQASFQNTTDSTSALQVQNAAGTSTIFNVDTVNGRVGIGKITPAYKLDIAGGDLNLSSGRSVRFGGNQALSTNSDGSTVSITNFLTGGTISAQADNFVVQDANATNVLLTADAVNNKIVIGNPAGSATPVVLYLANKNTAGDPATGAEGGTYYNSTMKSFRCFYSGFWQNCADREPQHSFSLYDEFLAGQTSFSSPIGNLGWIAAAIGANGSLAFNPATPTPSADRPGVLRLQTPAVANQGTTLLLGEASAGSMLLAKDNDVKTAVATGAATGQVLRVGLHTETGTTTQPVSGVWWEANPAANANWRYCYGDGAVATCAVSTVAIAANTWATLEIRVTATGSGTSNVFFIINNTPFQVSNVTVDTTNRVSPAMTCYTTGASAQSCYWDYFQLTGTTAAAR
ncbi:MAG TPA: hypothetical protein VLH86_05595 [Patescibacteria group bacterium]|nr:hypothetical protein [Patescibacteria group bacterium]